VRLVLAMTEQPKQKARLRIPKWIDKVLMVGGLALVAYVVSRYPLANIEATIAGMWPLVALTPLIALAWFCCSTSALYLLLDRRVGWWRILWIRLVGDSYNALLPLAGFGGEPFKIRQLSESVEPATALGALIRDRIIDNAIGFLASGIGCAVGLLYFTLDPAIRVVLLGYVAFCGAAGLLGFALISTRIPGRLGGWMARLLGDVEPDQIQTLPLRRVLAIAGWYTTSRLLGMLEKATLLWILGQPHDPATVVFIDGFLSGAGYIGFFVPAGLGIFEGAAVYVFGVIGASGPIAVAFAVARRGRMLVVGLFGVALHVAAIARDALRRPAI